MFCFVLPRPVNMPGFRKLSLGFSSIHFFKAWKWKAVEHYLYAICINSILKYIREEKNFKLVYSFQTDKPENKSFLKLNSMQ